MYRKEILSIEIAIFTWEKDETVNQVHFNATLDETRACDRSIPGPNYTDYSYYYKTIKPPSARERELKNGKQAKLMVKINIYPAASR